MGKHVVRAAGEEGNSQRWNGSVTWRDHNGWQSHYLQLLSREMGTELVSQLGNAELAGINACKKHRWEFKR